MPAPLHGLLASAVFSLALGACGGGETTYIADTQGTAGLTTIAATTPPPAETPPATPPAAPPVTPPAPPPADPPKPPAPTTGSIDLTIAGLAAGTDGYVEVKGPGAAFTTLASRSFGPLTPGDYTITAAGVLTGTAFSEPAQASATVKVAAGPATAHTVRYTAGTPFALALQEVVVAKEGLPTVTYLASPPGDTRLFIATIDGRIRIHKTGPGASAGLVAAPFLDVSSAIATGNGGGLFSFAFHPQFGQGTGANQNWFVFVHYVDKDGAIVVARHRVDGTNPDLASILPADIRQIIRIPRPTASGDHFGGKIAFGPDGFLYLSTGDAGTADFISTHAQNQNSLWGKLLRIDPDLALTTAPFYSIPATNPFAGQTTRKPEIWAYGLRNPWRFTFDGNQLYIADVGQERREEVNVVLAGSAGLNFGWSVTEGSLCFPSTTSNCSTAGYRLPVLEYTHDDGSCSITGGFVYRGTKLPELQGRYLYADFCKGWIRSMKVVNNVPTERVEWNLPVPGQIVSFGRDWEGELYVLTAAGTGAANGGRVLRIVKN